MECTECEKEIAHRNKYEEALKKHAERLEEMVEQRTAQLRETQEQMIHQEKLAAVGQLVSGAAHELNTPLMVISGYAELLMESVGDESSRQYAAVLNEQAHRAASIVRNLLSFARDQKPEKKYLSVNEVIESVVELRAYDMNAAVIEIEMNLFADLSYTMADYQQLQQVFMNLLVNAEQAMTVSLNSHKITIRTWESGGMIHVSVSDNGPGISNDVLGRIFEPFFTTKDVGEGTGLGLSICHGFIEEHGGKINAKSNEGEGSTFEIALPVLKEAVTCAV